MLTISYAKLELPRAYVGLEQVLMIHGDENQRWQAALQVYGGITLPLCESWPWGMWIG